MANKPLTEQEIGLLRSLASAALEAEDMIRAEYPWFSDGDVADHLEEHARKYHAGVKATGST